VNKMDCDVAQYGQARYDEVKNEMKEMLVKIGWKKDFVDESVAILPISGWIGDNLIKPSEKMAWFTGCEVKTLKGDKVLVKTLLEVFEKQIIIPPRITTRP